MIGWNEESKTMDESINFNKDNIFDYLHFILYNRNADERGDVANNVIDKFYEKVQTLAELTENSSDTYMEVEELVETAFKEISDYSYDSGFREACRLWRTLNSF